jgi:predicted amidohydrolase
MIGQLRLTLVQSDLAWQDADANRSLLAGQLAGLEGQSDLIVLPEMFTSAFVTGQGAIAESWPGPTLAWMQEQASRLDAAVCGSIAVEEQGKRLNRLLFVTPEGELKYYDKRHLFRMLGEHERYAAGHDKLIVEYKGWRILPLVCYDLRFPVWCRSSRLAPWDLMLVVANWPAARTAHWRTLLQARAIENLAWTAGVNRVGRDGNGLDYDGYSMIVDPQGNELLQAGTLPGVYHASISSTALQEWRSRFPAWMDADHFSLGLD